MNKSSSLIEKSEYILEEENKIIDKSNILIYFIHPITILKKVRISQN